MRRTIKAISCVIILACGHEPPSAAGQAQAGERPDRSSISPADWPMYNHDPAGWRFNPAEKTLGPGNVGKLVEKWRFPAADSKETIGVVHATPAVVAGEVYFGTATFPAFYKLAPDGKLRWVYRNPVRKAVLPPTDGAPITEKLRGAASDARDLLLGAGRGRCRLLRRHRRLDVLPRCPHRRPSAGRSNSRDADVPRRPLEQPADGLADHGRRQGRLRRRHAGAALRRHRMLYRAARGRGFLVALDPKTGKVVWKHDVGPKPEKLDPPVVVEDSWGKHKFEFGPATSSVWSTPSYDPETNTLFFGTDVNTAPRKPTPDNPALHTRGLLRDRRRSMPRPASASGTRRSIPATCGPTRCAPTTRRPGSTRTRPIGDTPKIFTIDVDGKPTKVVGAGCKNGGFYVLRADNGKLVRHTPVYTGPPTHPPAKHDPRVLALPSPIGGLQSGCATDGRTIFTNGIDAVRLGTQASPFARVKCRRAAASRRRRSISRPNAGGTSGPRSPRWAARPGKPMYRDVGDIVGSGIAVGNGVAYFTAVGSGKLIALDAATGAVLKEIDLGPVFAGPSLSRGRVYVGGGNTLFSPSEFECFFPKKYTGSVQCFGLPGEDEVDKLAKGEN